MNKQEGTNSLMGKIMKTLYPISKTTAFTNTKLQRPPLALKGKVSPAVTNYKPNKDYTHVKNSSWTMSVDARFDSLRDKNKIKRE